MSCFPKEGHEACETVNDQRSNTHSTFTILDEVIDLLFPKGGA